jgi:hypothetical protein
LIGKILRHRHVLAVIANRDLAAVVGVLRRKVLDIGAGHAVVTNLDLVAVLCVLPPVVIADTGGIHAVVTDVIELVALVIAGWNPAVLTGRRQGRRRGGWRRARRWRYSNRTFHTNRRIPPTTARGWRRGRGNRAAVIPDRLARRVPVLTRKAECHATHIGVGIWRNDISVVLALVTAMLIPYRCNVDGNLVIAIRGGIRRSGVADCDFVLGVRPRGQCAAR